MFASPLDVLHLVLPSKPSDACSPLLSMCCMAGNVRVVARVRPGFEHEDSAAVSFPDDFTLRLSVPSTTSTSASAATSAASSPVTPPASSAADRAAGGSAVPSAAGSTRREVELDAVLGPHIGQGERVPCCAVNCALKWLLLLWLLFKVVKMLHIGQGECLPYTA